MLPDTPELDSGEADTTLPSPQPRRRHEHVSIRHQADILVVPCHELDIHNHLSDFMKSLQGITIGLAPIYDTKCCVMRLSISSPTQVLVIAPISKDARFFGMTKQARNQARNEVKMLGLQNNPTIIKTAFRMDRLSAMLYLDHHITISHAKDLLSAGNGRRHTIEALMSVYCRVTFRSIKRQF